MSRFLIDPDARLDYSFDWTDWLAQGETITAHDVIASSGITIASHGQLGPVVTVWVEDAQPVEQRVTCRITTSAGRIDDRSIDLLVVDR